MSDADASVQTDAVRDSGAQLDPARRPTGAPPTTPPDASPPDASTPATEASTPDVAEDADDAGAGSTPEPGDASFVAPSPPEPPRRLAPPSKALDVTAFGARPGSDCTQSIQQALDSAAAGDTVLIPAAPEPYLLRAAGANPFQPGNRYALRVPSGVTLFIATDATLKLDDAQQSDASGPVDLIVFSGESVTITGGGTIRGNTTGQTDWTGRGGGRYQQITAGCLLRGFQPLARVRVSDLHLLDSFSNPINLNADDDVALERIVSSGNGEGPQVIGASNVLMSDLDHDDLSDVSQGDAVEVSDVDGFAIRRVRIRASAAGAGSALDIFGSRNGVIEDVDIEGWAWGIDLHDWFDGTIISDELDLRRIRIVDAGASAILVNLLRGSARLESARISHSGLGVHTLGDGSGSQLRMTDLTIEGCGMGLLLRGAPGAQLRSSTITGSQGNAIEIGPPASRVELIDVSVHDGQGWAVAAHPPATGELAPQVVIEGGDYTRNAAGAYVGLPPGSRVERAVPSWP